MGPALPGVGALPALAARPARLAGATAFGLTAARGRPGRGHARPGLPAAWPAATRPGAAWPAATPPGGTRHDATWPGVTQHVIAGSGGTGHGTAEDGTAKGTSGENAIRGSVLDDRVLLLLHLKVEQAADRLLLDALHHGAEHVVTLALVLHQRVALAVAAQRYALTQVVHLIEVLAPLAVEDGEDDPPLQLTHHLGGQLCFPPLVGSQGVLLHHLGDQVGRQAGPPPPRR